MEIPFFSVLRRQNSLTNEGKHEMITIIFPVDICSDPVTCKSDAKLTLHLMYQTYHLDGGSLLRANSNIVIANKDALIPSGIYFFLPRHKTRHSQIKGEPYNKSYGFTLTLADLFMSCFGIKLNQHPAPNWCADVSSDNVVTRRKNY